MRWRERWDDPGVCGQPGSMSDGTRRGRPAASSHCSCYDIDLNLFFFFIINIIVLFSLITFVVVDVDAARDEGVHPSETWRAFRPSEPRQWPRCLRAAEVRADQPGRVDRPSSRRRTWATAAAEYPLGPTDPRTIPVTNCWLGGDRWEG